MERETFGICLKKFLRRTMMKKLFLYVHGKDGDAKEAEHYKKIFVNADVIGLDYKSVTPWDSKEEFMRAYQTLSKQYESINIIANSLGAYFAMNAWADKKIERAFFISPVVDMEKLIENMMFWADISEEKLAEKKEIAISPGEILSWKYLCYVRTHPIVWNVPTDILYAEKDHLISKETIYDFARSHQAIVTVMKNGEHWFHTEKQMEFLDNWLMECLKKKK